MDAFTEVNLAADEFELDESSAFFGMIANTILGHRPKFRGPLLTDLEWFERETHVPEKVLFVTRCFTCGCESSLEVDSESGIALSIARCARQIRCSPEQAVCVGLSFVEDENGSQQKP